MKKKKKKTHKNLQHKNYEVILWSKAKSHEFYMTKMTSTQTIKKLANINENINGIILLIYYNYFY